MTLSDAAAPCNHAAHHMVSVALGQDTPDELTCPRRCCVGSVVPRSGRKSPGLSNRAESAWAAPDRRQQRVTCRDPVPADADLGGEFSDDYEGDRAQPHRFLETGRQIIRPAQRRTQLIAAGAVTDAENDPQDEFQGEGVHSVMRGERRATMPVIRPEASAQPPHCAISRLRW